MGSIEVFNYLTVMVSVLVGVGITRLFAGLGDYVAVRRRVRTYWVHSTWVVLLVLFHVHVWWAFWELREVPDWDSLMFAVVLLGPAALVIASHIAIPNLEDDDLDLDAYYYDTSTPFFAILALTIAWAQLCEWVLGIHEFSIARRTLPALAFCTLVACAVSKNRRLHAAAAVVMFIHLVVMLFLVRAQDA